MAVVKMLAVGLMTIALLFSPSLVTDPARAASPTPLAPTGPADTVLAANIQFRQSSGLRADPAYVASVIADPSASSSAYGAFLLPSEVADIAARVAVQDQLRPLQDAVDADHTSFAGIWIDQQAEGTVVIELAPSLSALPASVSSLVPSGAKVRLQTTRYGRDYLEGVANAIGAALKSMRGQGVDALSVGVDVPNDLVRVGVANPTAADQTWLNDHYGPAIEVVAEDPLAQVSLPTGCSSRTDCRLEGGLAVSNISKWECTSDFSFKSSGYVYLATAGHCWDGTYYQRYEGTTTARYIGNNYAYSDYPGMTADVMLMTQSATTAKNLIYQSDSDMSHAITNHDSNAQQIYGQYACGTGYVSGYRCGPIIGTNLTETVPCPSGPCTEYHMWEADFRSSGGDSVGRSTLPTTAWASPTTRQVSIPTTAPSTGSIPRW